MSSSSVDCGCAASSFSGDSAVSSTSDESEEDGGVSSSLVLSVESSDWTTSFSLLFLFLSSPSSSLLSDWLLEFGVFCFLMSSASSPPPLCGSDFLLSDRPHILGILKDDLSFSLLLLVVETLAPSVTSLEWLKRLDEDKIPVGVALDASGILAWQLDGKIAATTAKRRPRRCILHCCRMILLLFYRDRGRYACKAYN